MKLNQELIDKLAKGEIQLHNTGTVEQLNEILKSAFPDDAMLARGRYEFYSGDTLISGEYDYHDTPRDLPIYTTEQFYHVPDVGKTIDAETRELAKQLYVFNPSMGAERAIKQAKLMVKLLNEQP